MIRIDIVTLFPELCECYIDESVIGRGRRGGLVDIRCHNIRDYTDNGHRQVDDYPYGGGQGMLLQAEPIARCFDAIIRQLGQRPTFIFMSPKGEVFSQRIAKELSSGGNICLLCGHYEGVDQRLLDEYIDREISLGDFILTGGELAACVMTNAITRLQPGVFKKGDVTSSESFENNLLEPQQYTRPEIWRSKKVPAVLLGGNHKEIAAWKHQQALEITKKFRPDLLDNKPLKTSTVSKNTAQKAI